MTVKEELIKRFIDYAKSDTQSNPENKACPSSKGQWVLAHQLIHELEELGLEAVRADEFGYVMAVLPANTEKEVPTIGFMAHLDTASDFTGKNVHPQIIENYDGEVITLNSDLGIVLSPKQFPELSNYQGHTLITTDGTTLLGADDKAGIAEIITAMHYLMQHPEIKHGKISVAFTPDEEISRGPDHFDPKRFGATYAYTLDTGTLGVINYETFNAAEATIIFKGNNVHTGQGKGKLVNSIKMAYDFQSRMPDEEAPETTDGYNGFYHLSAIEGLTYETKVRYMIRYFDQEQFSEKKQLIRDLVDQMRAEYGSDRVLLSMNDQYYNMKEKIEEHPSVVAIACQAMKNLKIEPVPIPIRGGTDGSRITFMGLPTPNLFTGGENYHGRFEYISAEDMVAATQTIIEICKLFEANSN